MEPETTRSKDATVKARAFLVGEESFDLEAAAINAICPIRAG